VIGCIRACSDIKENFVIGGPGKARGGVAFDLEPADGRLLVRVVAANHGLLSDGALTNKLVHDVELPVGTSLDADELLALPMFRGVSGTFLELNRGAVVRRTYAPGEIICREGEYGSTAFYILSGKVDIFIETPIAHVKDGREKAAGRGALLPATQRPRVERRRSPGGQPRRLIPIDALSIWSTTIPSPSWAG